MAADDRNLFKDTPRALQRKIRIFKVSILKLFQTA